MQSPIFVRIGMLRPKRIVAGRIAKTVSVKTFKPIEHVSFVITMEGTHHSTSGYSLPWNIEKFGCAVGSQQVCFTVTSHNAEAGVHCTNVKMLSNVFPRSIRIMTEQVNQNLQPRSGWRIRIISIPTDSLGAVKALIPQH